MHAEQQDFFRTVLRARASYRERPVVYDFGSLDINGNNRGLFHDPAYLGIDICPGRNVDVVGHAHEIELSGLADVVISGESLSMTSTGPRASSLWRGGAGPGGW